MAITDIQTASWARRMGALVVDWVASTLVVIGVIGYGDYAETGSPAPAYVLLVYVLQSAVLTWLTGGSFGKLATRLRVVRVDGSGRNLQPFQMLLRQVLVALVIPPLVYRPDGRGLHDLVAHTATITIQEYHRLGGWAGRGSNG